MSQPLVRRPENWKFSHAAAAMGEFWARARKIEARRRNRMPQRLRAMTPSSTQEGPCVQLQPRRARSSHSHC